MMLDGTNEVREMQAIQADLTLPPRQRLNRIARSFWRAVVHEIEWPAVARNAACTVKSHLLVTRSFGFGTTDASDAQIEALLHELDQFVRCFFAARIVVPPEPVIPYDTSRAYYARSLTGALR